MTSIAVTNTVARNGITNLTAPAISPEIVQMSQYERHSEASQPSEIIVVAISRHTSQTDIETSRYHSRCSDLFQSPLKN